MTTRASRPLYPRAGAPLHALPNISVSPYHRAAYYPSAPEYGGHPAYEVLHVPCIPQRGISCVAPIANIVVGALFPTLHESRTTARLDEHPSAAKSLVVRA